MFEKKYATCYDVFYGDKDYEKECDIIEDTMRRHGNKGNRILDLGCGTGRHAGILAKRGYSVVGVDMSQDMIDIAKETEPVPTFLRGDIRTFKCDEKFDAVIMMFAVLGYMTSDDDVMAAMKTASDHLVPGGVFIADFWYAPAVLSQGLRDRVIEIDGVCGKVTRTSKSKMNKHEPIVKVEYTIKEKRPGYDLTHIEWHSVRYFSSGDIQKFLAHGELQFIELTAFPNTNRMADERTWNTMLVAKKK